MLDKTSGITSGIRLCRLTPLHAGGHMVEFRRHLALYYCYHCEFWLPILGILSAG